MSNAWEIPDSHLGLEMSRLTQVDVVSEFQKVVATDAASAVGRYEEFVERLEQVSSQNNPQIRSLIGGPDSFVRAQLIEIMAGNYQTASDDVKVAIRDKALKPLLKDNYAIVKRAVGKMTNPFLVGDIVREEPLAHPGTRTGETNLRQYCNLQDPAAMQEWLETAGGGMFAAASIARLKDHEDTVLKVMEWNEQLFWGAAHVVAASQDTSATLEGLEGSTTPKEELVEGYRSSYVANFAEMTRQEAEQALWLPIGSEVLARHSRRG